MYGSPVLGRAPQPSVSVWLTLLCRLALLGPQTVRSPPRSKTTLVPEVTGDGGGYLVEREARSEKHATDIDID